MTAYPILSLCPEEALGFLARIYSILVVCSSPRINHYRGRVLLHTLAFPDEAPLQRICFECLQCYGFDTYSFPGLAIQGLATIAEVFPYDAQRFARDRDDHGCGESLVHYRLSYARLEGEVWGVRLSDTYFLETPVVDILPSISIQHGDFWMPHTSSQYRAVEKALLEDEIRDQGTRSGYYLG